MTQDRYLMNDPEITFFKTMDAYKSKFPNAVTKKTHRSQRPPRKKPLIKSIIRLTRAEKKSKH